MSKTRNDEIYEQGVKDGLKGDLIDDFAEGMVGGVGGKDSEIYHKGYEYGVQHRYDSPEKENKESK